MSLVAPVVTVDGPAGSGKSTLGRGLARALRLPLVDTGLLYRGVTVAAARRGIAIDDLDGLAEVARGSRLELNTDPDAATPELLVDGADAGADLRDPRHAGLLARVSSLPAVREALLEPQRALARDGAVAVGRDCGTVVFPDAPVKFYLEASEPVRLQRRVTQLRETGAQPGAATMTAEVTARDRADSTRTAAPLRPAPDAVVIDTELLDVDAMLRRALEVCAAAGIVPP